MNITCLGKPIMHLTLILCMVILFTTKCISQDIPKIRIDPAQAYGGHVSEYFETVEYIPLETTEKSIFGQITQLVITDSSYVVYDYDTKSVLFFDLSGRYIQKVKFHDDSYYVDIRHNCADNYIIIKNNVENENQKNNLLQYSLKGVCLNKSFGWTDRKIEFGDGYSFKTSSWVVRSDNEVMDTTINLITIYRGLDKYKEYLPINPTKNLGFSIIAGYIRSPNRFNNDTFYVATPINHIMYRFTKDDILPIYKFIFPRERTIPDTIFNSTNRKSIDSINRLVRRSDKIIVDVSNIVMLRDRVLFKINQ